MSPLTHGDAQDLVERLRRAWERRDVDRVLEQFAEDAELRPDPFGPTIVGATDIRAWCNEVAASVVHAEADAEHIWLSGDTVLVAFHGAWSSLSSGERHRIRGMLVLELDADRAIRRARAWPLQRVVGIDSSVRPTGASAGPHP